MYLFANTEGQSVSDSLTRNILDFKGFSSTDIFVSAEPNNNGGYLTSAVTQLGLFATARPSEGIRLVSDMRFRYGREFGKEISLLDLKEAYISWTGKRNEIIIGQKVLKSGRADFTNPTSKFTPADYVLRSVDRNDRYMGSFLLMTRWFPFKWIEFEAFFLPFSNTSRLLIEPVELPSYVNLAKPDEKFLKGNSFGLGFRSDIHLKGFDFGILLFDGYEALPGLALSRFSADLAAPIPSIYLEIGQKPFRTRVAGIDYESSIGGLGLRGEAAFSVPYDDASKYEFVPLPELKITTGADFTTGKITLSGEYTFSHITDYFSSPVNPLSNSEPDYQQLAQLIQIPGFDLNEFIRQQIASFNRLCINQLDRNNHTGIFRAEADLGYGIALPSVTCIYNFTTEDLLILPEVKIKPKDGFTITVGAEYYKGKKSSLFDLIDELLTTVYVGFRIDF
jgi:hypothetical protein